MHFRIPFLALHLGILATANEKGLVIYCSRVAIWIEVLRNTIQMGVE